MEAILTVFSTEDKERVQSYRLKVVMKIIVR